MVRAYLDSLEQFGIKLGLSQIRSLLAGLGHPDEAFASALVAGTNGKGSVVAMAECALRAAGWRTGRYTSPHLSALEERVAIDGTPLTSAAFDVALERVREAASHLASPPTYFEVTTAAALDAFRTASVDVAVLEVGLGGRLDATNAVEPVAGAITAIDYDHTAQLGHRLEDIAREKAGIARRDVPLVLGPNPPVVRATVREVCREVGARLVEADDGAEVTSRFEGGRSIITAQTPHATYHEVALALLGRHQVANALTAVRLLEAWPMPDGSPVSPSSIRQGLEAAVWPGRLELVHWRGRPVLLDGAHNPAGARALAAFVREAYGRRLPFVVGVMGDKAIDEILAALAPAASTFALTHSRHARAAAPLDLAARARAVGLDVPVSVHDDPGDALVRASDLGSPVVVAGSLYLVGQVRPYLS